MFGKGKGRGLHVVPKRGPDEPQSPYFRAGESIPLTGIYRAFHSNHRVSHDVTLLAGEAFPVCAQCGSNVHFELLHEAQQAAVDLDFRIRLYQLPHPEEESA
jgi:hypothetical protein